MKSLPSLAASLLLLFGLALGTLGCTTEKASSDEGGAPDVASNDSADAPPAEEAPVEPATKEMGPWEAGDRIASGMPGVKDIEILEVHANGAGDIVGNGKSATLKYVAMMKDGKVLDPGRRPFTFVVGRGSAIKGWDVIVSKMRVGDSFTLVIPQELAYGASKGDLKFDMELLSFK